MITTDDLKKTLIEGLVLEDIDPSEIADDDPLFNEGLGLDSVDAIELVVILDNEYGIKFEDMDAARAVFASIQILTDHINKNATK
ncbi:MAG TPA: acyl carrier protein [Campylobacterales bacterium]|nr:acyl carrier protein [Campylobacterales bacterium]